MAELINSQILENKLADAKTVKPLNNCANNNIHRTTIVNKQKVSLGIRISKDINFKFKIEKKRTVLINIDINVKLTPYWENGILYLCKAVLTGVGHLIPQKDHVRIIDTIRDGLLVYPFASVDVILSRVERSEHCMSAIPFIVYLIKRRKRVTDRKIKQLMHNFMHSHTEKTYMQAWMAYWQ